MSFTLQINALNRVLLIQYVTLAYCSIFKIKYNLDLYYL